MVVEALRAGLASGIAATWLHDLPERLGAGRYESMLLQLATVVADAIQDSDAQPLPTLTTSQLLTVHSALDLAAVYTRLVIARSKEDLPGHEDLLAEQDELVELFDRAIADAEEFAMNTEDVQTGSTAGVDEPNRAPEGSGRSAW